MKKILTLSFISYVLAACATTESYTNKAMKVSMEMTKEQVVEFMGPPKRVAARKSDEGLIERLSWWTPKVIGFTPIDNEMLSSDRVFVRFLNGKVIEWGDKYDFSENIEKTLEIQTKALQKQNNTPTEVNRTVKH